MIASVRLFRHELHTSRKMISIRGRAEVSQP
jgi:hypothetical protein